MKNLLLAAVAIVVVAGILIFFILRKGKIEGPEEAIFVPPTGADQPCPGPTIKSKMKDPYMAGVLDEGESFEVISNYYACHPVKKGDLVYYRFGTKKTEPVVKMVRAHEGDHFNVVRDKEHNSWNLVVNGRPVMYGTTPYFFGSPMAPPTLSLYIESRKGVLLRNEVILLSAIPPGMSDSGIFGLVSLVDVVGKVVPLKSKDESVADAKEHVAPAEANTATTPKVESPAKPNTPKPQKTKAPGVSKKK